jgi:hypothetical protein
MRPAAEMPFEETTGEGENGEGGRFDRDRSEFALRDGPLQALAHKVDAANEQFVDALRSERTM